MAREYLRIVYSGNPERAQARPVIDSRVETTSHQETGRNLWVVREQPPHREHLQVHHGSLSEKQRSIESVRQQLKQQFATASQEQPQVDPTEKAF